MRRDYPGLHTPLVKTRAQAAAHREAAAKARVAAVPYSGALHRHAKPRVIPDSDSPQLFAVVVDKRVAPDMPGQVMRCHGSTRQWTQTHASLPH